MLDEMSTMTMEDYKTDLIRIGYLTDYWDGKKSDYACTMDGMDRLVIWMHINDDIKSVDFQAKASSISAEKKQLILKEFISKKFVTRIYHEGNEKLVPTEKGINCFGALLFWQDDKRKKKYARVETAKKIGIGFMKGLVKTTVELQKMSMKMNESQSPPKKVKKKSKKKSKEKSKKKSKKISKKETNNTFF